MFEMHDWTLQSIHYEWEASEATLIFCTHMSNRRLIAKGVRDLHVPHQNDWGLSISVNEVRGPVEAGAGVRILTIEMQSGDRIEISATEFALAPA